MVPAQRFERRFADPKSAVLPVRRSGNGAKGDYLTELRAGLWTRNRDRSRLTRRLWCRLYEATNDHIESLP